MSTLLPEFSPQDGGFTCGAVRYRMLRYYWNAAVLLDPDARALDEGVRFPICAPDPLMRMFQTNKVSQIKVEPLDATASFRDFDDYWAPFEGKVGPALSYVSSLAPAMRQKLKETLRRTLHREQNGAIQLKTRAWAIKGAVV